MTAGSVDTRVAGAWRAAVGATRGLPSATKDALAVLVLAILAASRMYLRGGLLLYDEQWYFETGVRLMHGFRLPFAEGPGYCYVYGVPSIITGDLAMSALLGSLVGPVAMVVGVYVAARLLTPRSVAFAASLLLAATFAPYHRPGVTSFAAGLAVVAIILLLARSGVASIVLSSALLWASASCRPEYWPAAAMVTVFALVQLARPLSGQVRWRTRLGLLVVALGIPLAIFAGHGVPWQTNRLFVAFGQHYAHSLDQSGVRYWTEWDVWAGRSLSAAEEASLVRRDFGAATSLYEAVVASPTSVLRHAAGNVARMPIALAHTLVVNGPGLTFPLTLLATLLLLAPIALAIPVAIRRARGSSFDLVRSVISHPRGWPMVVLLAGSLATAVLIWPRTHYLQLWVALTTILAAYCLQRLLSPRARAILMTSTWIMVVPVLVAGTVAGLVGSL